MEQAMIKASLTRMNGRKMLVFGLSAENVRRLKDGQPIAFSMDELGVSGDVLIMYGETEASIVREINAATCNGSESKGHASPSSG